MSFNHVIDKTFFYDAIEQFAFNYTFYNCTNKYIDEYGRERYTYSQSKIRGSLQTNGTSIRQSQKGNTNELSYEFYCKSLFQISEGDFIYYENNYLRVTSVKQYNEYGVRQCHLQMVQLSSYRDLSDYIDFINGKKLT